jgi:hypothetical protein
MSQEMAHKVIVPQKKIMSQSFLNSGTLVILCTRVLLCTVVVCCCLLLGSIPGRCSSIFGIWREVLGRNVYITSQYFTPAIIYRDIIYALCPSSTPLPTPQQQQSSGIFRNQQHRVKYILWVSGT